MAIDGGLSKEWDLHPPCPWRPIPDHPFMKKSGKTPLHIMGTLMAAPRISVDIGNACKICY
jgi:hypothetical protein